MVQINNEWFYTITRERLEALKKKYGLNGLTDEEALSYLRRNVLTGFEKNIMIIEKNKKRKLIRLKEVI
ncbi:MAG: hypothetical protein ACE5KE_00330 [Methanosarcinales archaeon]